MRRTSIILLTLIGLVYVEACDKTSCTPTPSHYEELNCKPVLDEEQCCPIRYECPERSQNGPDAGCQYRGKFYQVGEKISEQFLPKRCDEECTCEHWIDENTYKITCRGISSDDADLYRAENTLKQVPDKDLDESTHLPIERCHGIAVTDTNELVKLKKTKCHFDGITYKQGEKIKPDGVCYECICDEKLKTSDLDIFAPQCQRKQCGIGTSGEDHDFLNRGCAPVYDKTSTICCPIEWRCPEVNDVVKKSGLPLPSDRNMRCKFGDLTLKLLDQVLYEGGDKLNCKCYIPPMVHCMKNL